MCYHMVLRLGKLDKSQMLSTSSMTMTLGACSLHPAPCSPKQVPM